MTVSATEAPDVQRASSGGIRLAALLSGIALLAVCIQIIGTDFGIGISPDTVKYVRYARTMRGMEPPTAPSVTHDLLVHYPPFYPALLAAVNHVCKNIFIACRFIQATLFALNVLLIGYLTAWVIPKQFAAPLFAAILMITLHPILTVHLWGWSEPLFIFSELVTLWALVKATESASLAFILLAGVTAAIATLTRYAGLALVPCGCTILLLCRNRAAAAPRWRSALRILIFCVVSGTPLLILLWHNQSMAGNATGRQMGIYRVLPDRLREATITLFGWFYPLSAGSTVRSITGGILAAGFLALFAVPTLQAIRHCRTPQESVDSDSRFRRRQDCWLLATALFVCFYVAMLIGSILFYDPLTPLDDRILAPIAAAMITSLLIVARRVVPSRRGYWASGIGLIVIASLSSIGIFNQSRKTGLGFRADWWRHSSTLRAVALIPPAKRIYSNEPDAIYALTGRPASEVAARSSIGESPFLAKEIEDQKERIAKDGMVVYFDRRNSVHASFAAASLAEIETELDVRPQRTFHDGAILKPAHPRSVWAANPPPASP